VDAAEAVADGLAGPGWALSQCLFPADVAAGLAAEARQLAAEGRFRPAGVGHGRGHAVREGIRADSILWLDEDEPTPAQSRYWQCIEVLRRALNRLLFLGLEGFEGHLAAYPTGGFYAKHLDRFSDADERAISVVLFLNRGWRPEDGGALRLHLEDGAKDIAPELGTAAVFRSDLVWHEVLPAAATRLSATGWYRRRPIH